MQRIEFGTDGIRGIVGEWPWFKPIIMRIGQALGEYIRSRSNVACAVIGRDTRSSGADFLSDLCTGMLGQGVHVINLGIMTTPGVAFLTKRFQAELGVIVSASHSPLGYNGIKLVGMNGLRLQREEEIEIETLINGFIEDQPKFADFLGQETNGRHLGDVYIDDHVKRCPLPSLKGFKVVLDCAHGATGKVAPEIFRRLGSETIVINDTLDGDNINYHSGSEFVRVYPDELMQKMQQSGANYGFAFDGDGDRLVVVDKNGRVFDGQDLLFILALHYKSLGLLKNNTIVTTRLANLGFEETLRRFDISVAYASKGDRNLEAAMWGGDFMLGGEIGGNLLINDGYHTAADAVYTALVLSSVIIQSQGVTLQEIVNQLSKHPQEIMSFAIEKKFSKEQLEEIEKNIENLRCQLGENSRILFWESATEHGVYRVLAEGGRTSTQGAVIKAANVTRRIIEHVASEPILLPLSHKMITNDPNR
jgi:phosphoglucosamine mutase